MTSMMSQTNSQLAIENITAVFALRELIEQINRNGKEGSRVIFRRDFTQGLKVAPVRSLDSLPYDRGFSKLRCCLEFAIRVNDFGRRSRSASACFAMALHFLRQINLLHLDIIHFDTPWIRLTVEHSLNSGVNRFTFGLVRFEFVLPTHRPQSRLS